MNRILHFWLVLLMVAGCYISGTAQSTESSYDALWQQYKKLNKAKVQDAYNLLDTIELKAATAHQDYQQFRARYERSVVMSYYQDLPLKTILLYLDSMKQQSTEPYRGLFSAMIGFALQTTIQNAPFSRVNVPHYDLHRCDEWDAQARQLAGRDYFNDFLLHLDSRYFVDATQFDFMSYSSSNLTADRPTLADIILQTQLDIYRPLSMDSLAYILIDKALQFPHVKQNPEIALSYELERSYFQPNPRGLHLDSLPIWQAYQTLEQKYGHYSLLDYQKGRYLFELAKYYDTQLTQTDYYTQSLQYLNKVIAESKMPELRENALHYKALIEQMQIDIPTDQEDFMPTEKLLIPIQYRNLDTLYITVVQTNIKILKYFPFNERRYDSIDYPHLIAEQMTDLSAIVQKQRYILPNRYPYQSARTDIWLDSLPTGNYVLLFHRQPEFDSCNVIMTKALKVTNLNVTSINNMNRFDLTVTDRRTGKPIEGCRVTTHSYPGYHFRLTDGQGSCRIPILSRYYNEQNITVKKGKNDIYQTQISYVPFQINRHLSRTRFPRTKYKVNLVTDRSLYRPGQTLFFKAVFRQYKLAYKNFEDIHKSDAVVSQDSVVIYLRNGKRQIIDSIVARTNEFGSVAGQFKLPANEYGYFSFDINSLSKPLRNYYMPYRYITVADYKRPTFEVNIEKCKEEYRLGDTLTISGQVISYAGVPLDGATVNLTCRHEQTTEQFTTTCDRQGHFEYRYSTKSQDTNFYYSYLNVTVSATDVNGETHDASAGYTLYLDPLVVRISQCQDLNKQEDTTTAWIIQSLNNSNQPVPVPVEIKVEQLTTPPVYREYLYKDHPKPTQPLYSEQEYLRYFPQYTLDKDEQDKTTWPTKQVLFEESRICTPDSLIALNIEKWPTGFYRVTIAATDKVGKRITKRHYFTLKDSGKNVSIEPVQLSVPLQFCAGNDLPITLSSALQGARVTCHIFQGKRQIYHQNLDMETPTTLHIPTKAAPSYFNIIVQVTQNDYTYNATSISYSLITSDPKYPYSRRFRKQATDPKLQLKLTHWNKLLEPGSTEHWELEINHNDSVPEKEVELLAFMYDYSLNALGNSTPQWISSAAPYQRIPRRFLKLQFATFNFEDLSHSSGSEFSQNKPLPYSKVHQFYYPTISYPNFNGNNHYYTSDGTEPSAISYSPPVFDADQAIITPQILYNALSSLDGAAAADGEMTSVRGNRADGQQTIVDGVQVRAAAGKSVTSAITVIEDGINMDLTETMEQECPNEDFTFSKDIRVRSNFTETAFFYPQLRTDAHGKIKIDFTIPDQYTRWQFLAFAHNKTLQTGTFSTFVQTQRSLMIQTNCPRFVREGDTMNFQVKISNLRDTILSGHAGIELFDYECNRPLSILRYPQDSLTVFTCPAKGSTAVSWEVIIPQGVEILGYRVLAQTGLYGDGEENALPVLSNRTLVNESLHFTVPADRDKSFVFNKLQTNTSPTLQSYSYTMEVTGNPVWYAIQSLPYLMTYRYDCNEQLFSKLYANAIAGYLLEQNPEIEKQYAAWAADTIHQSLQSPLTKNEELKNILLEETPWYYAALNESSRKQQNAELFNRNRIDREIDKAFNKLRLNQNINGGWSWFGKSDYSAYITQHIVAGFYKLEEMGITMPQSHNMIAKVVRKMDSVQSQKYRAFMEDKDKYKKFYLSELDVQYLYARTFGTIDSAWLAQPYVQFYLKEMQKDIDKANLTRQAEHALIMHRIGQIDLAREQMEILRQQATRNDDEGMYWRRNDPRPRCYYYPWYEAPIERQALLIEAFSRISPNQAEINAMKQWLLAQKHSHYWSNTKATAEAVYALLLNGSLTDSTANEVSVTIGNNTFYPATDTAAEAGTGYLKKVWKEADVTPALGDIHVHASATQPVFGACYWQYFEDMDKVTAATEGLSIERALFREIPSTQGVLLDSITPSKTIQVGEQIIVRLVIRCDRDLEYVHIKDLRAAAFEPTIVADRYTWQHGLRYYQCPRDASMNFFIDYLSKGTHILEYPLTATQTGEFSNGFASIECMYAPEFRAQSDGFRIKISPLK